MNRGNRRVTLTLPQPSAIPGVRNMSPALYLKQQLLLQYLILPCCEARLLFLLQLGPKNPRHASQLLEALQTSLKRSHLKRRKEANTTTAACQQPGQDTDGSSWGQKSSSWGQKSTSEARAHRHVEGLVPSWLAANTHPLGAALLVRENGDKAEPRAANLKSLLSSY